jgi:benzoyl-CoA reductase/2-hydroxyglutaryl-CoA dehydratase subunit BcrC/BadD/HgdB
MSIYEDAKKLFVELLGLEVAKVIDTFEDPKKYPKEFLEECKYFLAKIVGEEPAKEKLQPIYEKYFKKRKATKKITSSKGFLSFLYGKEKNIIAKFNFFINNY